MERHLIIKLRKIVKWSELTQKSKKKNFKYEFIFPVNKHPYTFKQSAVLI